jgi:hypothetical protein
MKIWKNFLPEEDSLKALSVIRSGPYFVDQKNDPEWETVYFQSKAGKWISLTWSYFDVEFKFETYGMSIELVEIAPEDLVQVGEIVTFSQIDFFIKTEWTRPTIQGEVPANFEQIIEENGTLAKMPNNAIAAGTALHALVFSREEDDSKLMMYINDNENYSLKSTNDPMEIAAIMESCDALNLFEILAWEPPL